MQTDTTNIKLIMEIPEKKTLAYIMEKWTWCEKPRYLASIPYARNV